jgi:proteasome accessory factor C
MLDKAFERPPDADDRMAANRAPTVVDLVVPQSGRWAVDRFAESVQVVADDEESVQVRAALLPPVADRLGLVLLSAGPAAFVTEPADLREAGVRTADRLLAHHTGDDS